MCGLSQVEMADESVTINAKKSWKKLDINVTSYGEGLLDGFLGIEELTDYEIIKHEPPTTADKASFKKSKLRAKSRVRLVIWISSEQLLHLAKNIIADMF